MKKIHAVVKMSPPSTVLAETDEITPENCDRQAPFNFITSLNTLIKMAEDNIYF